MAECARNTNVVDFHSISHVLFALRYRNALLSSLYLDVQPIGIVWKMYRKELIGGLRVSRQFEVRGVGWRKNGDE